MTSPLPDAAIEAGARFLCAEMSDDWREGAAYWKYVAQGFITALAAEGLVVVPRRELTVVVGIADRNVTAPAIDTLRAMIEAAQPATEPRRPYSDYSGRPVSEARAARISSRRAALRVMPVRSI